jgi:hypothetical protein
MRNRTLHQLVEAMPPDEALQHLAAEMKPLLAHLEIGTRRDFLVSLMGGVSRDRETSLAHL